MPSLPTLSQARINCHVLDELFELRKKGWEDEAYKEALDCKKEDDRKRCDQQSEKNDGKHFNVNKNIMHGIHVNLKGRIRPRKDGTFLDLGFCPGGFSAEILELKKSCQGIGICLPREDSGIGLAREFELNKRQMERFIIQWEDLSFYDICCPRDKSPPTHGRKELQPFIQNPDGSLPRFQLVILDAHYRRQQRESNNSSLPWDISRLLISQLIIALETLQPGGNLIISLKCIERINTAQIIYMLDGLAEQLVTYKPPVFHCHKSLFYAIALGIGKGKESSKLRNEYIIGLKNVWWELTYGGDTGSGRWLKVADLDFIVTEESLTRTYLKRIKELGRELWSIQADGLTKLHNQISRRRGKGNYFVSATVIEEDVYQIKTGASDKRT